MATTKKPAATKKSASTKSTKSTNRKSTATKSPAKKPAARNTKAKKVVALANEQRSFRVQREDQDFFRFRATQQTLYWTIFAVVVLALSLWILKLHLAVEELYHSIEVSQAMFDSNTEELEARLRANND